MAENPEGPKPNKNDEDGSQLMENVRPKQIVTSSVPGSQDPDHFNLDVPSETTQTTASSGENSFPVFETLSPLDIDRLIGSCDLKSEEITSLMAEKVPSSDSEFSYGSFTTLKLENKDVPHFSKEDVKKLAAELAGGVKLDESTMKSWLADGSDDSALSSCREPLIPMDDESDMEEFNYHKENVSSDTKLNDEKEEPFVDDLISLKESEEKILEPALNDTDVASENLLDIVNDSEPNQTAIGNKSLLDMENEAPHHLTDVANESLLDIEIETPQNLTAEANKSLLDIEFETPQNFTAVANKSLMNTEIETSQNFTAEANKSPMDTEIEASQNTTALANKSLLDIENEETSPEGKEDSNSETEKCARICIEHIKVVLSDVLKEVKKSDASGTAMDVDAANGNGLKTLEEELREEAENSTKIRMPHWDAEMGWPKVKIRDSLRIVKDESFKRNIKIIGICSEFQTSPNDHSNDSELKKEDDELLQSDKTDEAPQGTFQEADSNEYTDVTLIEEASPQNDIEEQTSQNVTAEEIQTNGSDETNITYESPNEREALEKKPEDVSSENLEKYKAETDDVVKEQKSAVIKSILKKKVTFASTRGHPGMEHMALHHEENKIGETQIDMDTSLRFLTETYPSHEDEEMLSESLNATLEPCALSRTRRESPRAAELYEELKILEGDEHSKTQSCSPCQSPERSEFFDSAIMDNKTVTNKSGNKFSRFFKTVKKKIWN